MKILLRKSKAGADNIGSYGAGKIRLFFIVFNNDFKGAGDGAGRANKFTHRAPAAVVHLDDFDGIIFHLQSAAGADANAQSAAVAFSLVNYR